MSDNRRPRVLVVTTNWPLQQRGDRTGNFVYDPVVALANDVDFTVVAPLDSDKATRRQTMADTVSVFRFGYWWPRRTSVLAHGDGIPTNLKRSWLARAQAPSFALSMLWQVTRHARHADVVHAHWLPTAALAVPARALFKTPIVVTVHGSDLNRFPHWFSRWCLHHCDQVISAHEDLLDLVARLAPEVPRRRIRHLVPSQPTDATEQGVIRQRLGHGPMVLFVARLSPEREPLVLIRAIPAVVAKVPHARFAIVGDGTERQAMEAEIQALGIADHVVLFGHRPDVWNFLGMADAMVAFSNRKNAWMTVVAEATYAGVPLVATTETLQDCEAVLRVPGGSSEAVAEAVIKVLSETELGEKLNVGARKALADNGFDPEQVRDETLRVYQDLLANTS